MMFYKLLLAACSGNLRGFCRHLLVAVPCWWYLPRCSSAGGLVRISPAAGS
jgi:hypothetical protein